MHFRAQETITEKSNNFILQLILTHLIKAHKFDLSTNIDPWRRYAVYTQLLESVLRVDGSSRHGSG